MQLDELLDVYLSAREASVAYRSSLLRTVRKAKSCGLSSVDDLCSAKVNRFLLDLSSRVSATTRSNVRRELLTLWRFAFETGETDVFPQRIVKIRPDRKPVQAWSLTTLAEMLAAAERDETRCGGIENPRLCDWLPAWIAVGFDTGLRFTDIYEMPCSAIRNGCVSLTAHKTGKPLVRVLSGVACRHAERLADQSPDGSLFRWMVTRRRAFLCWRNFLDRHGWSGSSKWLRRSCATYLEQQQPGSATVYLQHSAPHLVRDHYLDQSLGAAPAGPPSIR